MTVLMLRARVTEADIVKLARSEPAKVRAEAARKICLKIADGGLSPEDRRAADEVVRIIAADRAQMVRRALAETLAKTSCLPRDTALRLARDVDDIAAAVLEGSSALVEQDLVAVVRSSSPTRQRAVASRKTVSAALAELIIDNCDEDVVAALARNDGAQLDASGMASALRRFSGRGVVAEALIDRSALPLSIAERLIPLVSGEALQRLARRHALSPELAIELARRGAIDVLDQAGCAIDMPSFVEELQADRRLTPALALRGLCLGHLTFFECAMAALAGVSPGRAWALIHDAGPQGLGVLFDRTGAPQRLLAPMRAALDMRRDLDRDGLDRDRDRISLMMIERLLSRPVGLSREDGEYLLGKLDALMATAMERAPTGERRRRA
jgi:uncharacterized protein (DUF2336 family)